jgi:hypothetical protein
MAGGAACTPQAGATGYSIRSRLPSADNSAFCVESSAEQALLSVHGLSGDVAVKGIITAARALVLTTIWLTCKY